MLSRFLFLHFVNFSPQTDTQACLPIMRVAVCVGGCKVQFKNMGSKLEMELIVNNSTNGSL